MIQSTLALITLLAVIASVAVAFFVGPPAGLQHDVLIMLITALIGELKTQSAYLYDGVPKNTPDPIQPPTP